MLPIVEETCRAIQAVYGLVAFTIPPSQRKEMLATFTKDTYESLDKVQSDTSQLNAQSSVEYCTSHLQDLRLFFSDMLKAASIPIFNNDNEEDVWQLFLNRYDFRTMQLRANTYDMRCCFNISSVAEVLNRKPEHLYRLPVSAEIIMVIAPSGIGINVEIPARLLFLDMLLMFRHAQASHHILDEWVKQPTSPEPLQHRARLDAYVRQVIITGACACESVLSDYGMLAESIQKSRNMTTQKKAFSKLGLSAKLDSFISAWSEILELPKLERPDFLDDMLKLVQTRNRLVHYDGRISAWHALNIDFNWLAQQGFSDRIKQYLRASNHGLTDTFVGYELQFAEFYIDTVIKTIDLIHQTIYRVDAQAYWMNIPRTESGNIEFSAMDEVERMLAL